MKPLHVILALLGGLVIVGMVLVMQFAFNQAVISAITR